LMSGRSEYEILLQEACGPTPTNGITLNNSFDSGYVELTVAAITEEERAPLTVKQELHALGLAVASSKVRDQIQRIGCVDAGDTDSLLMAIEMLLKCNPQAMFPQLIRIDLSIEWAEQYNASRIILRLLRYLAICAPNLRQLCFHHTNAPHWAWLEHLISCITFDEDMPASLDQLFLDFSDTKRSSAAVNLIHVLPVGVPRRIKWKMLAGRGMDTKLIGDLLRDHPSIQTLRFCPSETEAKEDGERLIHGFHDMLLETNVSELHLTPSGSFDYDHMLPKLLPHVGPRVQHLVAPGFEHIDDMTAVVERLQDEERPMQSFSVIEDYDGSMRQECIQSNNVPQTISLVDELDLVCNIIFAENDKTVQDLTRAHAAKLLPAAAAIQSKMDARRVSQSPSTNVIMWATLAAFRTNRANGIGNCMFNGVLSQVSSFIEDSSDNGLVIRDDDNKRRTKSHDRTAMACGRLVGRMFDSPTLRALFDPIVQPQPQQHHAGQKRKRDTIGCRY